MFLLQPRVVLVLAFTTCLALDTLRYMTGWVEHQMDDVIFDTLRLSHFSVPSLSKCLQSCSQDARCVSVLYHKSKSHCQLKSGRFYLPKGGREEQGWRYYLMKMDPRCPVKSGYIHRRDLSLCYRLEFQVGAIHADALSSCTMEGGHLLRVDTREKQDLVEQQIDSSNATAVDFDAPDTGAPGYYVDGKYVNGTWFWPSNGQEVTFSNWRGGQSVTSEDWAFMMLSSKKNWKWMSVNRYIPRSYICEIPI